MTASVRNKYPSPKVSQCEEKTAFSIDCDGGLGAAFHHRWEHENVSSDLIKSFPDHSDIFLFFNCNDPNIVPRSSDLGEKNDNVHVFPTVLRNVRNGADVDLSFILGLISDKYDSYVLIAGHDRIYDELQKRLEFTYSHLKGRVDLQRFESPAELTQYVQKLNNPVSTNQMKSQTAARFPTNNTDEQMSVTFKPDDLFRRCPLYFCRHSTCLYRCGDLLLHLESEHASVRSQYCSICEELIQNKIEAKFQLFKDHVRKEHVENNAGFRLVIRRDCM